MCADAGFLEAFATFKADDGAADAGNQDPREKIPILQECILLKQIPGKRYDRASSLYLFS
jgi:hypothetical protein